ncbi:demethylmenaquinone methyltransferase [Helcobacillus massiliensis]|uniref:demethylmenaquinone methyltransferase n=1 Tax=Helcobacillus massiliensis TaxID=521392 RepID=UPI002556570F|nr:demethylmenaquinone methyltransferase [Helcobacillus massiliensis]MDK7743117.1 demethylmenaquinone methyltransferase [Helcobacillus massiliensis]WOO91948.1 demethylmenaquinone methyltransferase [Helcobacillus massiliensis]
MNRADLSKKPVDVSSMFDGIAGRYDLLNDILAFGQVRSWRRAMVEALDLRPHSDVLDVAAGTGTSSAAIAAAGHRVIASDFSEGMMQEGRRRQPHITFIGADATALPFADDSFDSAVVSFGLRNVQQPQKALAEMTRVVRPGGSVVVCEFSTPNNRVFRHVYSNYLMKALPAMASAVASDGSAYTYLAESIAAWPDQQGLRSWFLDAGLEKAQYRNLTGGIVALHRGYVPATR